MRRWRYQKMPIFGLHGGCFTSLEAFVFWVSLKAKTESQCLLYAISTLAFTKEAQKYQFILILTI